MSEPAWVPLGVGNVASPTGIGTSLPTSPVDGQEFTFVDSLIAPTYAWRFRYLAAKATNRWVFVGGSSILAEVPASETIASTTYAALATPGPIIAVPIAGDYEIGIGAFTFLSGVTGTMYMSYDIGGTGAVDVDGVKNASPGNNGSGSDSRWRKKTGLTAVTLTAKYKTSAGTATFENRWMRLIPIAVGG